MDVPRIMALIIASMEGDKVELNDTAKGDAAKIQRLAELQSMIEHVPVEILGRSSSFPALGFVVSSLLKMITGSGPPSLRIRSAEALFTLLRRNPSKEFIETVVPALMTGLLRLAAGWEREPASLILTLLACMELLLVRGGARIKKDGKFDVVISRISRLACTMRQNNSVGETFLKVILKIKKDIPDLSASQADDLLQAIAMIIAHRADLAATAITSLNRDMSLFLERLNALLERAQMIEPSKFAESSLEGILEEILGWLHLIPTYLWPSLDPIVSLIKLVIQTALQSQMAKRAPSFSLDDFGSFDKRVYSISKSLLKLLGARGYRIPWAEELNSVDVILLAFWVSDSPEEEDSIEIIDYALDIFDRFTGRQIETDPDVVRLSLLAEREEIWYLSWCYLISQIPTDLIKASLDYLLKPLLFLLGSPVFMVREAASTVIIRLASTFGGNGATSALLSSRAELLFDLICSDLRFPLLFPNAPRQLVMLLESCPDAIFNVAHLTPVIRDLEERAADFQTSSAYILVLLQCFNQIIKTISGHTTMPPTRTSVEEAEAADPKLSVEQELGGAMIKTTVHFVTDEDSRIRLESLRVLYSAVTIFDNGTSDGHDGSLTAINPPNLVTVAGTDFRYTFIDR